VGWPTIVGYFVATAISVCSAIGYTAFTHAGAEYNFVTYLILLAAFFGVVAASQAGHLFTSSKIQRTIKFLADYSFSLYLVHHTIMYAMWTIFRARGAMMFAIAVIISNLIAIGLAEAGEKHHRKIAKALSRKLLAQQSRAVLAP
jgi:peptidoglycan/LPS O-acetylase OafA/YrhL